MRAAVQSCVFLAYCFWKSHKIETIFIFHFIFDVSIEMLQHFNAVEKQIENARMNGNEKWKN
jgi:glycopeptide antibiotics resistance protein